MRTRDRRRRRIDDAAPYVLQKPEHGWPRATRRCTRARSAGGWSTRRCHRADRRSRRGRRTARRAPRHRPRGAGPLRPRQPPARRGGVGVRVTYENEVVTVEGVALERDESIRPDTTLERLSKLRPAFRADGTVTAGNSSPLNDGAAALLLAGEAAAERIGRQPLGTGRRPRRLCGRAALVRDRAGRGGRGGAEARRHRLGRPRGSRAERGLRRAVARLFGAWPASSTRRSSTRSAARSPSATRSAARGRGSLGTLAWQLHRHGGGYGLAAMCIGVGQGIAVVLEGC